MIFCRLLVVSVWFGWIKRLLKRKVCEWSTSCCCCQQECVFNKMIMIRLSVTFALVHPKHLVCRQKSKRVIAILFW